MFLCCNSKGQSHFQSDGKGAAGEAWNVERVDTPHQNEEFSEVVCQAAGHAASVAGMDRSTRKPMQPAAGHEEQFR